MTFGPYKGVVDHVHDGDTVHIRLDVGFDLTVYTRVRVLGINAPELRTDAGKASRDFAKTVLPASAPVEVVSHGWDKWGGRIDGVIQLVDGRDFAAVMVEAGQAAPYTLGERKP